MFHLDHTGQALIPGRADRVAVLPCRLGSRMGMDFLICNIGANVSKPHQLLGVCQFSEAWS